MNEQEQINVNGRLDSIDMRLDRLATEVELMQEDTKRFKEHSTDLLQAMDLLAERTNQMIDAMNRHDTEIFSLKMSQARAEAILEALAASQKTLSESQKSLSESQTRTNEVLRQFSLRQARDEDQQEALESRQAATDETLNRVAIHLAELSLKQRESDEIVNRLSQNVDRYLSARLNGGTNN